jgi:CheY-like chemotaxis protein
MGSAVQFDSTRRSPYVLVVDDDRDTRELYRACFDTSGYLTGDAETGSQAIAAAIELLPDVVLTDYVLPDVDGITVARRLKADARTAQIRILMITGHASDDIARRAVGAGIDRVLLKPCLPQAIMREVSRTLWRRTAPPPRTPVGPAERPESRTEAEERSALLARLREEFSALPGLALTAEQARLVFDLPPASVEGVLGALVREGFLSRTPQGSFRRS